MFDDERFAAVHQEEITDMLTGVYVPAEPDLWIIEFIYGMPFLKSRLIAWGETTEMYRQTYEDCPLIPITESGIARGKIMKGNLSPSRVLDVLIEMACAKYGRHKMQLERLVLEGRSVEDVDPSQRPDPDYWRNVVFDLVDHQSVGKAVPRWALDGDENYASSRTAIRDAGLADALKEHWKEKPNA